jgi:hypothetical protein
LRSHLLERRFWIVSGLRQYVHNHALDWHWARPLLLDIAVKQAAAASTFQNPIFSP